jgi:Cu(I)/Ag(I) efflux system membrane fusion protein
LEIQTGLAADDLAAAKKGASHFQHAMKAAPHAKDAHDASIALSTSAKKILEATDIKSARVEFLNLSGQFTTLVEHVGTSNKTQLYIAHCPMAFGNKGGSWVQSDKTLANPYYGAMMLRCGSLQKQIAGKASNTESHEGHSH